MDHVSKDLFLVPLGCIAFADNPKQAFYNPRYSIPGHVQGLEAERMEELYESIKSEGLQNPPTVRLVPDLPKGKKVQLIRGERRVRCLQKLVSNKNEMCYDQATKQWVHSQELYEKVICHVVDCDNLMANKIAFSDNEQAVGIGEACTAAYVRKLKSDGLTSDEIMRITGKKASWLRDEESLLKLDDECFNAFVCGEINRTIALELVEIDDTSQRQVRLRQIKDFALARHQEKIVAATEAFNAAEEKVELLLADVETAETPEEQESVRGELIAAQTQAEKKQKNE
jgi:ParB-like chromosome segregation protein Spo0J